MLERDRYRPLCFDAGTEARYLRDMSRFYAPVLRVTVSFTILFYIAYLGGDRLLFGRFAGTGIDLLMLGIAAPASLLGIASTYLPSSDRLVRLTVYAATLVNAICQVWSYDLGYHAGAPIPYEGMILIMCFAFFMLGMQYRWALLLSLLTMLAHLLVSWQSRMPASMLFDHATMMSSVVLIGAMAGYLQDLFSRRSWSNEQRLRELAERDALTGLYNRRHFDASLQARIADHARHGDGFSLLMIDIDHFKRVNDQHGHDAGDQLLQAVAGLLGDRVRADESAFRLGGEEFALLITDHEAGRGASSAEGVRAAVEALRVPQGVHRLPSITVSLGVARYTDDDDSASLLLQRADAALYVAKRSGRNRVCHSAALVPAVIAAARPALAAGPV